VFSGTEIEVGKAEIKGVEETNIDRVNGIVGLEIWVVRLGYVPIIIKSILPGTVGRRIRDSRYCWRRFGWRRMDKRKCRDGCNSSGVMISEISSRRTRG
jgi:hypothetical protein